MAGGKETPRQKMIGIMYLVLMAMLAINVSDSVLNAFRGLTESLEASNKNVEKERIRIHNESEWQIDLERRKIGLCRFILFFKIVNFFVVFFCTTSYY